MQLISGSPYDVYDARLGYDETLATHATASALNLADVHANNSSSCVDVSWTQVERWTAFMKRLPSDLRQGPDCQLKSFSFYLLMPSRMQCGPEIWHARVQCTTITNYNICALRTTNTEGQSYDVKMEKCYNIRRIATYHERCQTALPRKAVPRLYRRRQVHDDWPRAYLSIWQVTSN